MKKKLNKYNFTKEEQKLYDNLIKVSKTTKVRPKKIFNWVSYQIIHNKKNRMMNGELTTEQKRLDKEILCFSKIAKKKLKLINSNDLYQFIKFDDKLLCLCHFTLYEQKVFFKKLSIK